MRDDQIRGLLRTLEDDRAPDPAFADALYRRLNLVVDERRRSRVPFLLLAAALLAILAGGFAMGSGLLRLPVTVDASGSPQPSASGVAVASPSTSPRSSELPAPSDLAQPSVAPESILFAEADGLRIRSEPSESGEVEAIIRRGQLMGATGAHQTVGDTDWYEVRMGPGDLTGWVAAGPDNSWVRLVGDGAIAFARNASGRPSVALVTPLEDDAIVTLRDGAFLRDWTWSPDGSRLAGTYADTGDALDAMVVMEPDGTIIANLGAATGPAAWSPDGSRLAWVDFDGRIVVTDDSLEPAATLDAGRSPHAIAWSPDGSRFAYLDVDCDACPPDEPILGDPPIAVFTIAIDGSDRRQLTSGNIDGAPSWSADGAEIAFLRFDLSGELPTRLFGIDAAGGEPREHVEGAAITGGASWSPDGFRLALATSAGVVIGSPDGTAELVVPADEGALITEIQWSPSGRYLLYGTTTDSSPAPRLWIVEADGSGEPRVISPSGEGATQARWQPILVAP